MYPGATPAADAAAVHASNAGDDMASAEVSRNDPCPCGSGDKYKRCCLGKEQVAASGSNMKAPAIMAVVAVAVSVGVAMASNTQTGLAVGGALLLAVGAWAIFRDPPPPKKGNDHPASINFGG